MIAGAYDPFHAAIGAGKDTDLGGLRDGPKRQANDPAGQRFIREHGTIIEGAALSFQASAFQNSAFQVGVIEEPTPGTVLMPGKSGPSGSVFTRKRFEEIRAAERAAAAALRAAEKCKRVEQQEALEQAGLAAQEAIESAQETPDIEVDFAKLTRALESAVSAKNFATSLKRAGDAVRIAQAIMAEEEEEAIMLLLLH